MKMTSKYWALKDSGSSCVLYWNDYVNDGKNKTALYLHEDELEALYNFLGPLYEDSRDE